MFLLRYLSPVAPECDDESVSGAAAVVVPDGVVEVVVVAVAVAVVDHLVDPDVCARVGAGHAAAAGSGAAKQRAQPRTAADAAAAC